MSFKEARLPDFLGLRLDADAVNQAAIVAENVEFRKAVELSKRGGFRRLNHQRYDGAIVALPDVQRICDYNKFLVISDDPGDGGEVYEHGDGTGGTTDDPFFDPCWAPVAVADAAPLTGTAPLDVDFSSAGSFDPEGGALSYAWDFGDGGTSDEPNPTHVYATAGVYPVTLTVTNSCGKTGVDSLSVDVTSVIWIVRTVNPLRRSTDGGATWATPTVAAGWGGSERFFRVGTDIIVPTWNESAWDYVKVFRSVDDGLNFTIIGQSPPVGGAQIQRVAVFTDALSPNFRRIVSAHKTVTGRPSCHYSDDDGLGWSAEVVIDADFFVDFGVQIALAPSGNLYAFARGTVVGPGTQLARTWVSADGGATWTALTAAGLPDPSVVWWTGELASLEPADDGSLLLYIVSAAGNWHRVYRGVVAGPNVTWTQALTLANWNTAANLRADGAGNILFLSYVREHYHSSDNGQNWALVQSPAPVQGWTTGRMSIWSRSGDWYAAGSADRKVYRASANGAFAAQGIDFHAATGGFGIMVVN